MRRALQTPVDELNLPSSFRLTPFIEHDAAAVHALLADTFGDEEPDVAVWWAARSQDPEYDPTLVFCVADAQGLVGVCWCWTSAFIKDLAVAKRARRHRLGEALCLMAFRALQQRGASHVDLKTNIHESPEAVRLYRRLGMREVAWDGAST